MHSVELAASSRPRRRRPLASLNETVDANERAARARRRRQGPPRQRRARLERRRRHGARTPTASIAELEETLRDVQTRRTRSSASPTPSSGTPTCCSRAEPGGTMSPAGFACIALLALAPGCALLAKSEPVVPRYFSPEAPALSDAHRGRRRRRLELRLGRVNAAAYINERIVYRDSAYELGYYEDALDREARSVPPARARARALRRARRDAAPVGRRRDARGRARRLRGGARAGARGADRARCTWSTTIGSCDSRDRWWWSVPSPPRRGTRRPTRR